MLGVFYLAVRLRLRLKVGSLSKKVVALVNSGYEADTPQLLIPANLAKELGLWPPPSEAVETFFNTAGGPLKVWILPKAAEAQVLSEEASSGEATIDLVVSPIADEPLISDMLAGRLEIAVEDFAEGLWRFRWEPKEKVKRSAKP
ncbi:MAG: hypothetical protein ACP5K1_03895 [Candidatus Bathyarchaeia archaeon]